MPNQHTTAQRVRDFVGEENFIADFTWNDKKKCFRLVYRTHSGVDMLIYIACANPTVYGKGWVLYESFDGIADFNRKSLNHGGVHFNARYQWVNDMQRRSVFSLATQYLRSYASRYTRPAYFNADGSTRCKYTQEQLDKKEF
jgi:hypothetical protein